MKQTERVTIAVPPEAVWTLIEDLGHAPAWHPKIVTVKSLSGRPGLNAEYETVYTLNGKETVTHAVTTAFEPPRLLENTFHAPGMKQPAVESFTLKRARGGGTHLCHQVRFLLPTDVPPLLRALVWFVLVAGRKAGKGPLDHLKETAEELTHGRA